LTTNKEQETIIINRPDRSTYPGRESVLTSEATPACSPHTDINGPFFGSLLIMASGVFQRSGDGKPLANSPKKLSSRWDHTHMGIVAADQARLVGVGPKLGIQFQPEL
jgi:hypothetical protein